MKEIVGNCMATAIVLLVIASFFITTFNLLFRDGRGNGLYGNRGNSYMYNDE